MWLKWLYQSLIAAFFEDSSKKPVKTMNNLRRGWGPEMLLLWVDPDLKDLFVSQILKQDFGNRPSGFIFFFLMHRRKSQQTLQASPACCSNISSPNCFSLGGPGRGETKPSTWCLTLLPLTSTLPKLLPGKTNGRLHICGPFTVLMSGRARRCGELGMNGQAGALTSCLCR